MAGSRLPTYNGVSSQWAAQLLPFHLKPCFSPSNKRNGDCGRYKAPKRKHTRGDIKGMAKQHGEDILMTGRLVTHPTHTKVQKRAGVGGRGASADDAAGAGSVRLHPIGLKP